MKEKLIIYTDGGARGNPGPAAIGYVIKSARGKTLVEGEAFIGRTTNNVAEYAALNAALRRVRDLGGQRVTCFLDSELVVRQLNGQYRVKEEKMRQSYENLRPLVASFLEISFRAVPRGRNSRADELVNRVLDEQEKK